MTAQITNKVYRRLCCYHRRLHTLLMSIGSAVRGLEGTVFGTGSVISAGSVVTKNIPPYSIAVSVPAKVIITRA